jgi:hypothetical protein
MISNSYVLHHNTTTVLVLYCSNAHSFVVPQAKGPRGGGRVVANGDGGLRRGTAIETPTSRGVKFLDGSAMTPLLHGTRRLAADELFYDFEDGAQGWVAGVDSQTNACGYGGGYGVTASTHWELASSLPGSTGVVLDGTWWTNPNDGTDGAERSHVTSPSLTAVTNSASITFDSYTSNESGYPTDYDVEHVQLSINDGPFTDVHAYTTNLHNWCDQTIRREITFTTTSGIKFGDKLKYRFLFDSCDALVGCGNVVGWAFDNVRITGASVMCQNFAVHAQTTITFDGGMSSIHGGDVGVSPGTSITGSYNFPSGGQVVSDSSAFAASVLTTYAAAMEVQGDAMAIEIGGMTFLPGTYRSGSAINFAYGTVVTLDGNNEDTPVFLFIAGTTLVTAANTKFILTGGAKAENVYWALGSAATLGANSVLEGSILAGTAITFGTNSELHGCALAQSAVTFESDGSVIHH